MLLLSYLIAAFGFIIVLVPAVIVVQLFRLYWVCLWISSVENEMSTATSIPPVLITRDELLKKVEVGETPWTGEQECFDTVSGGIYYSMENVRELPGVNAIREDETIRVLRGDRNCEDTFFWPGVLRIRKHQDVRLRCGKIVDRANLKEWLVANVPDLVDGAFLEVENVMFDMYLDYSMVDNESATEFKSHNLRKKTFYSKAYSFVSDGNDFRARLLAVQHGLLTQAYDEVVELPLTPSDLGGNLWTLCFAVLENMRTCWLRIKLSRVFDPVQGNVFSTFWRFPHAAHEARFHHLQKPPKPENPPPPENISDLENEGEGELSRQLVDRAEERTDQIKFSEIRVTACIFRCVIMPLGWLVQQLLVCSWIAFAIYAFLFPLMSFAFSVYSAVMQNDCDNVALMMRDIRSRGRLPGPHAIWNAIATLYQEDCYAPSETPLNVFRSALFILQALIFMVVSLLFIVKARYFISFALALTKCDVIEEEADKLMAKVKSLYDKHYAPSDDRVDIDEPDVFESRPSEALGETSD
jgi:hypothetical protein